MSSDDDQDIAALEAALARAHAKKQRKLDQEQRRRDSGPQELVPGTPSPRKKRRSDAADLASLSRPAPPALFANPVLARSFNPSDKLELRDAPRRESQFVDHMSAVPKSFADALAERKTLDRVKQERKERQLENRARRGAADQGGPGGFSDLSSASKDVLLSGRTGDVRLKEKKPRPEAGGRATSTRSATAASSSSTSAPPRPSTPAVPAMSRPAPLGTSSTASSSRAPARPAPSTAAPDDDDLAITNGPARRTRRRDGTYIETVQMGSREFIAPSDDPTWERVEPYSGIRLRERLLPHADLDMLLDGRYHLTPAQVYSLARIDSRKRIDLDPDVIDSDFVVIGVLAWKDEVRFLNSGAMGGKKPPASAQDKGKGKGEGDGGASEDDDVDSLDEDEHELGRAMGKGKGKARRQQKKDDDDSRDTLFRQPNKRQRRQRYLRFELVDLSSTQASSAADGRLSVMLVQADSEDKAVDDEGNEVSVYKGQSGGAFEKFWKETAGAVVAIVNPTFLPHNKDFSYTLKPTSADSMVVLGRADNLAFCEATKADGKRCGQWVDARMGRVCQFHVERAIKRTGVRRAETNANTGSLSAKGTFNQAAFTRSLGGSSSSASSRLGSTGPAVKQRPLSPPPGMPRNAKVIAGSTTYVTTGARSSASSSLTSARANTLPLGRPGGGFIPGLREGPSVSDEKKRRQRQVNDDKRARQELRALVGRDKGKTPGGEYLLMSRKRKQDAAGGQGSSGDEDGGGERLEGDSGGEGGKKDKKPGIFRPEALRRIGYNPTVKAGDLQRDESDEAKRHRLALEDGLGERKIKLSAPKGAKRTAVSAPAGTEPLAAEGGDDDDDLVIEGGPTERVKLVFPPKKAD